MKILIPTDFSPLSRVATNFAIELSTKINAELILLKVVFIGGSTRGSLGSKDLEEVMIDDARKEGDLLVAELKSHFKYTLEIKCEVILGYPIEKAICNYADNHGMDLIVMGTKGATGLKKIFLGSNTAAVIDRSHVPVITVPELAKFKGIGDIVYATDILNLKEELEKVVSFSRNFMARIHILHVTSPREQEAIETKEIVDELIMDMKYNLLSIAVSYTDNPAEGIDEYVVKNKIDLLAMFTHELTFFEKILGKSITRQIACLNHVPLLVFKKLS